ncbi:hypothetical protein DID77_01130, partial [Candidatus Marinamargulisbacteria bacterium SCGC AG-439-L15]
MITKKQRKLIFILIIILLLSCIATTYHLLLGNTSHFSSYSPPITTANAEIPTPPLHYTILVHVAGAVKQPGVYRIKPGLRALDILKLAGGTLPDANLDKVNLAKKAKDGQRLFVPFQ